MRFLLFVWMFVVSDGLAQSSSTPRLLAGASLSNISPELGSAIVGGFSPFPAKTIHDELHVRCLVLDNGEKRVAIVVCDLLGASRQMFDEAAALVKAQSGLPREALLMSCTHTHSAASALNENRYETGQSALTEYQRFVAKRIADAVQIAVHRLEPARIGWMRTQLPGQVFNRRWFMKEGTMPPNPFGGIDQVKMNPPRGPNLLKPAGPTDLEVGLLSVQSLSGRPISVLANYSLHYVGDVGAGHVSADYFAAFCEQVQRRLGAENQDPPFVAMLSNGTSGNINNNDYGTPPPPSGLPYSKINAVAAELAQVVDKALDKVVYQSWVPLDMRFSDLRLGQRIPDASQVAWAEQTLAHSKALGNGPSLIAKVYAERFLKLKEAEPFMDVPLQVMRVGEVGISALPCETFVETGLELKASNPFPLSWTHSLAGGYFGYLPTPEQHALGGYETWLGTSRLEIQASRKISAKLLEMLKEMKQ